MEQDNQLRDATASTLRIQTATVAGFTALLEADNVLTLGGNGDRYDSFLLDAVQRGGTLSGRGKSESGFQSRESTPGQLGV